MKNHGELSTRLDELNEQYNKETDPSKLHSIYTEMEKLGDSLALQSTPLSSGSERATWLSIRKGGAN